MVRDIDRTDTTVLVTLRVPGREDFIEEWRIGGARDRCAGSMNFIPTG